MSSRIPSRASRNFNWILWAIPCLCLVVVLALCAQFIPQFRLSSSDSAVFTPAETIEVSESFSGELFFNTEFDGTVFSDVIVSAIDHASTRIEVAVYSINHPRIHDALYRAAQRGVAITLLLSASRSDVHTAVFSGLPEDISRIDYDPLRGSMHHKFLIVDRGLPGTVLLFGSYNFTELQERYDSSFLLQTTRPEIIRVFGQEFDRLYQEATSDSSQLLPPRNPFAARIRYPEGDLEIWFSPPNALPPGLRDRTLDIISHAEQRIRGMIWNVTDDRISRALIRQARNHISVQLLTDDSTAGEEYSVIPDLMAEGQRSRLDTLEVVTDAKRVHDMATSTLHDFNPFLHHHMLLADDRIVLFGTNNWSANGFLYNNEASMVSTIPYLVSSFRTAFEDNLEKAE